MPLAEGSRYARLADVTGHLESHSMSTDKFITAIQQRPALWKHSHPHHKFRHVLKKLWSEVRTMFPEYPDVKKKWKSLKDTYRKELKKIPVLRPNGGEAKKWKFFKLMTFIKDELLPADEDGVLILQEETKDSVNDSDAFDSPIVSSDQPDLCQKEEKDVLSPESSKPLIQRGAIEFIEVHVDQPMHSPSASTSTNNSTNKRRATTEINAEYLELQKKKLRIMEMELSRSSPNMQDQKSEDYHFLMSILPHVERLPPIQKMRLRNKINKVVLEEMELFAYGHQYGFGHFGDNPEARPEPH